ncbi:unnamed protein product [Phytomonas sp. EM1]|nr:unnamed protein product [Phytomonas sp. EM1]|eukprot:CCW65079.1 unnamed protein product [Phytomonas sp. isolate EM1]
MIHLSGIISQVSRNVGSVQLLQICDASLKSTLLITTNIIKKARLICAFFISISRSEFCMTIV